MSISDEQKEIVLLSIIEAMGGQTDAGDERWSWLQWFCADEVGKEADTFNRCIDKGWLKSSHDSDTDHSVAWITDEGITALSAAAKVRAIREGDGPKVFCAMLTTGVCDKTERIAELEAALDEGPSNPWRFWSDKANTLAAQLAAVTAENARLTRERDEARTLVTEANNSLYGSQGYFHSLNGGAFDKYHLASGIEALKASSRKAYTAAAENARLREALEAIADTDEIDAILDPTRLIRIAGAARRAFLSQEAPK